jgi:hypothetical protein
MPPGTRSPRRTQRPPARRRGRSRTAGGGAVGNQVSSALNRSVGANCSASACSRSWSMGIIAAVASPRLPSSVEEPASAPAPLAPAATSRSRRVSACGSIPPVQPPPVCTYWPAGGVVPRSTPQSAVAFSIKPHILLPNWPQIFRTAV